MNVMQVLIENIAAGRVKPHQLLGSIKAGDPLSIGNQWVRYRKLRPGEFVVEVGKFGDTTAEVTEPAESPVEAKLGMIDKLVQLSEKQKQTQANAS